MLASTLSRIHSSLDTRCCCCCRCRCPHHACHTARRCGWHRGRHDAGCRPDGLDRLGGVPGVPEAAAQALLQVGDQPGWDSSTDLQLTSVHTCCQWTFLHYRCWIYASDQAQARGSSEHLIRCICTAAAVAGTVSAMATCCQCSARWRRSGLQQSLRMALCERPTAVAASYSMGDMVAAG